MHNREEIEEIRKEKEKWGKGPLKIVLEKWGEREGPFETLSGKAIERLYTPLDISDKDYLKEINFPGNYPFTRGVLPTGYRGKLWTRRQVTGFATPEETNNRLKYLQKEGQTGINLVFDLPTHNQLDSDNPLCEGEVGKDGVPVDTLRDIEVIFDGIDITSTSTSLITGGPTILSMFLVLAQKRGVPFNALRGTLQNDILSLYYTVNFTRMPLSGFFSQSVDVIEYCIKHIPRWNPISFIGYQIREKGSTAAQEIAFTLGSAVAYTHTLQKRGFNVDDFAPRFSFFFNAHNDFFEEICKYRAARRLWARIMKEHFGAKNPLSWLLRYHVQTAGCSLTAQQPMNNIIRTTIQALAAVLGGANSLHTNSMDEAYALPSESAVRIALRTQQIIAYESGVTNTVDPLGGSYFIEKMTDDIEEEAQSIMEKIDEQGGMVDAVSKGWVQKQIQDAAFAYKKDVEEKKRMIVGVNCFKVEEDELPIEILRIDPSYEALQKKNLAEVRKRRDLLKVNEALEKMHEAAARNENIMPYCIEASRTYASIEEIMNACITA
ncbi:MAG: methylmalonyl-CoA mutase family protein [Syntrophales bacterium]